MEKTNDHVEVNVTGELTNEDVSSKQSSENGFDFSQIHQIPLGQLGYPQASEWIQHRKANVRPWALFINTNNIRPPPNLSRLSKRIMKNIEYFQSNYFFVFVGLVFYCLITSPLLLVTVVVVLGTCYKVSQRHANKDLVLLNKKLTLAQVYAVIGISSLPLFYLAGAGSVLFWVMGVSCSLITLHASFYNIDSLLCPGEDELNLVIHEM